MINAHLQLLTPVLSLAPPPSLRWLRTQGVALRRGSAHIGRAIWRGLMAHGRQRAQREMLIVADRYQHDNPKLARELRSYARGGSSY